MTEQVNDIAIRFNGVDKKFALATGQPQTVLEILISFLRRERKSRMQDLWALRDISFDIRQGETVGFVGTNGSGKSTLLKLAARIIRPTGGQIEVNGRVSALLELGAGFHDDLTGRENIFLSGSLMGLSREHMHEFFDDIVDFSELGEFIDVPVKHYSSGMYMRLAFSLAIHVSPDILFIDEILAVGDQAFQNKCFDRIHDLQRSNMTIVIVSHDLRSMQNLCDRLIWINRGEVMMDGDPREVLADYMAFSREAEQERIAAESDNKEGIRRWGSGDIEIRGVQLLDAQDRPTQMFNSSDRMTVEIEYFAKKPVENPQFGLAIFRQDGIQINSPTSISGGLDAGVLSGGGKVRYCVERLTLLPSVYYLTVSIHDKQGIQSYDYHDRAYTFHVIYTDMPETHGLVSLPARWEVQAFESTG